MSSPTFIPIVHIQSSSPMIILKVGTEKVFHQVWIFFTDNDVLVGFWKKKNEDFAVNSNIYNDYFFGELIFFFRTANSNVYNNYFFGEIHFQNDERIYLVHSLWVIRGSLSS